MPWYVYLGWFFAGAFLANSIPHIVQGICGNRFQTPFASPPGVGKSSAVVNAIWSVQSRGRRGAVARVLPARFAAVMGAVCRRPRRSRRHGAVAGQPFRQGAQRRAAS